jgi:hypothetical protein
MTNAIRFPQSIELLFSLCSLFCTATTSPQTVSFREDEGASQPVRLSEPDYSLHLKRWFGQRKASAKLFVTDRNDLPPKLAHGKGYFKHEQVYLFATFRLSRSPL